MYVGMEFINIHDDITFVTDKFCREDNSRNRRSFAQLFFKHHDVENPEEFEHTPCSDVLGVDGCRQQVLQRGSSVQQTGRRRQQVNDCTLTL